MSSESSSFSPWMGFSSIVLSGDGFDGDDDDEDGKEDAVELDELLGGDCIGLATLSSTGSGINSGLGTVLISLGAISPANSSLLIFKSESIFIW